MAVIKVAPTIFSSIKTIKRALIKANEADYIQVASGLFKESLHFQQTVSVIGKNVEDTIVEGLIIIPKNVTITFKHLSFIPTIQIYIEGKAIFEHCQFNGTHTSAIISLNGGQLEMNDCQLEQAMDVGIALFHKSEAIITNCQFKHNGKAHLLLENSTINIEQCRLSNTTHSIWLKKESSCISKGNHFIHQTGTQIIAQQQSSFSDTNSTVEKGAGNGIFATEESTIILNNTTLKEQALPQLWIQHSSLTATNCTISHGQESGLMAKDLASIELLGCMITHHKIANIQATVESRLNVENSQIHHGDGVGIQIREKSIANFSNVSVKHHTLSQFLVTEDSIISLKNSDISDGAHIGISLEKGANCTAVNTTITKQQNTAVAMTRAEMIMLDCEVSHNEGNGILVLHDARLQIDSSHFHHNGMPHIAGKSSANITVLQSEFYEGKSFYVIDQSKLFLTECKLHDSDGVQIEVTNQTTAIVKRCDIRNGKSNGIKALRDSSITLEETNVINHDMPQLVINDSSLIMKDCEILEGKRNGFIIENNSEAFIQDTFISKHAFSQIWIDLDSSVELKSIQLTEGTTSDIYVQNKSSVNASKCIIRNDHSRYNVQAINYSSIKLNESIVDNSAGECFYSENNSTIVHFVDEVNE